jgi:protein-L-isoaspartate O-methyltransferase
LELGCATGKATLPLAKRGFGITCIELGTELAALARQNLAGMDVISGHILMEEWKREKLFNEIRVRLNSRGDKSVRRHWGAVLHVARRKDC